MENRIFFAQLSKSVPGYPINTFVLWRGKAADEYTKFGLTDYGITQDTDYEAAGYRTLKTKTQYSLHNVELLDNSGRGESYLVKEIRG